MKITKKIDSVQVKHLHEVAPIIMVAEVYVIFRDQLVMVKRSENKKKFPGWWSVPGGHIDYGEDPLKAAIREVQEETGVVISPEEIKLKVVATHHHLDRKEIYVAFTFLTRVEKKPELAPPNEEGSAHLVNIAEAKKMSNVFPPVKYYFKHVLNDKPGVIYNNSEWENSQLVQVFSETLDANY